MSLSSLSVRFLDVASVCVSFIVSFQCIVPSLCNLNSQRKICHGM